MKVGPEFLEREADAARRGQLVARFAARKAQRDEVLQADPLDEVPEAVAPSTRRIGTSRRTCLRVRASCLRLKAISAIIAVRSGVKNDCWHSRPRLCGSFLAFTAGAAVPHLLHGARLHRNWVRLFKTPSKGQPTDDGITNRHARTIRCQTLTGCRAAG